MEKYNNNRIILGVFLGIPLGLVVAGFVDGWTGIPLSDEFLDERDAVPLIAGSVTFLGCIGAALLPEKTNKSSN